MDADFVVVGAGAAGCVLADRLSASGASVLLLEAGRRDRTPNSRIPAAFSKMFRTRHDWNYHTVPQDQLDGRRLYWPRGKIVGGTTAMNAMIYQRGNRSIFDDWAAAGHDGWGYGDLLPAFMELEDQQRGPSDFHGAGGPLAVSDLVDPNPLSLAFVESATAMGFPANDDFNGSSQDGFGLFQVTQRNGVRCSAGTAFLKPALARPNLTVNTGALVTRVVVTDGRATGVEWTDRSGEHHARAEREVVLCGGSVNSPQLLMLSGIGPAAHLADLDIPVVHDLPGVGQNLIDHPVAGVACAVSEPITLAHAEAPRHVLEYAARRRGLLTSNVAEAGGFVTLGDGPVPDLQFHFAPVYFIDHGFGSPDTDGLSLGPALVDVKSRGEITLESSDPTAPPRIDPRYLSDPTDLWLLVEGCKLAREIVDQPPLSDFVSSEYLPGPEVVTDDDWVAFIRSRAESLYHPVGTCAMGPVVDKRLRVHGVDRLRVADASIMPTIINANTQATSMVIGQRAADFLLRELA